jgi:S-adenosylmethionine:diacylglycerol 3-amino-3-carboxypropyl transferase
VKVGDLVRKRWGEIKPHQQNTVGVITEDRFIDPDLNPMLSGYWVLVAYPGCRPSAYRPREFEVISESR